jgi:hypothetical protein
VRSFQDAWQAGDENCHGVLDGPCGFHSLAVQQFLQNLFQSDSPLPPLRFAMLEFNPSFIEAIEHLHSGLWVFHSL